MDAPLPDDFDPYEIEMTEPNWFEIGLAAVIAGFGWLFKRHVGRVDRIEARHVTRESLDATLTLMRTERRDMHLENKESMQTLGAKLDSLVERVAAPLAVLQQRVDTLDGRVQELSRYTNDLKHLHIDPYEREVTKLRATVDLLERK